VLENRELLSSYCWATFDGPEGAQQQGSIGPTGIDDAGQIVGIYLDPSSAVQSYLKDSGGYFAVSYPGSTSTETFAYGINATGEIAGEYEDQSGEHCFLEDSSGYHTFDGYPGAELTVPQAINDAGQIVGYYFDASSVRHSFLKDSGGYETIDYYGPGNTFVSGINDAGQIVGTYQDASGTHGFLAGSGGAPQTIDATKLGAYETEASGINDAGQIVGTYRDASGYHGFLMDSQGYHTTDATRLGATNTYAIGINDAGQIVGSYDGPNGAPGNPDTHYFLATPQNSVYPTSITWGQYGVPGYEPVNGYVDGVTTYTYNVVGTLSQDVPVALYWSPTPTYSSTDMPVAGTATTIASTTTAGSYPGYVNDDLLTGSPDGTQYLLVVVGDPNVNQDVMSAQLSLAGVPQYYQVGSTYSGNPLDGRNKPSDGVTRTIGNAGCELVALDMALDYSNPGAGITGLSPALNPGQLNTTLTNTAGFQLSTKRITGIPLVNLGPATAAAADASNQPYIAWNSLSGSDTQTLRDDFTSIAEPIIVQVTNFTKKHPNGGKHFVVVTGLTGNTFSINDPGYMNTPRTTLSQSYTYPITNTVNSAAHNYQADGFTIRGYVEDPPTGLSRLYVSSESANPDLHLAVFDSQGDVTGISQGATTPLDQVPDSVYTVQGPLDDLSGDTTSTMQFVDISQPAGGYELEISGDGAYTITIMGVTPDGQLAPPVVISGQTSGLAAQYRVVFDPSHVLQPVLVGTSTQVTSDHLSGSVYGQAVTFTASVSASPPFTSSSADSVRFQVDGSNFGSAVPLTGGGASICTASLTAGTHTVTAIFSGDATFDGSQGTLGDGQAVAPAPLTVAADNQTMNHGDAVLPLTYTLSGFVKGDTPSVVSGSAALSTTASSSSPAGHYPITVSAGTLSAANYDFTFVDGTLTVQPKILDVRLDYGVKSISLFGLNRDVPFTTIKAIDVIFSDNVRVNMGDLALTGISVPTYRFSRLSYNSKTDDATWTLPSALGIDDLMLALDGETFAARPPIAVSSLAMKFAVLPGDVNGDGVVNMADAVLVRNEMQGTGDPSMMGWADLNGDGVVDINDVNAVRQRVGTRLPRVSQP